MSWMRRLLNTLRRRTLDREIEDELQFHVESRATDLQRAGMSADDARREARRLLGNDASLRDRTREADVWVRLETALQDMRYAARTLWRAPLFTIAATLTLAIGIGVNTAMFAVVYGVLIRPLPYADADRLYLLFQTSGRAGRTRVTPLDFVDLQAQARSIRIAGVVGNGFTFTGQGDPELAVGHLVSGEFFNLLGAKPALGRTFGTADEAAGNHDLIVLSHAFLAAAIRRRPQHRRAAGHRQQPVVDGCRCHEAGLRIPGHAVRVLGAAATARPESGQAADQPQCSVRASARKAECGCVSRCRGCGTPVGCRIARAGIPGYGPEHVVHALVAHRRDRGRGP